MVGEGRGREKSEERGAMVEGHCTRFQWILNSRGGGELGLVILKISFYTEGGVFFICGVER